MNTGTQLTKAQPAASTCSTYHFVASSEPTGRYETTTSVRVSCRMRTTSAVSPGALVMTCDRYLPMPSCVMPRLTGTPTDGTSANFTVLFWPLKTASPRSLPTLSASTSNAAENSMSETW